MKMEYLDHVDVLRIEHADLADVFARSDSLENVLSWMKERGFPAGSVDLVSQDEFSYDFLIRLESEDRWLVFGVN